MSVHEGTDRDPLVLAARVEGLWERAASRARGSSLEIYHRFATRRVAERLRGESTPVARIVVEEGLALRRLDGSRVAFAACSGDTTDIVDWLVARATEAADLPRSALPAWAEADGALRCDHDAAALPELGGVSDRLDRWVAPCGNAVLAARIEVATTTETWVAHGGFRASRRRTRTAAVAQLVDSTVSWSSRGSAEPDPLGAEPGDAGKSDANAAVELLPDAAAELVTALVAALHVGRPDRLPSEVGAGWVVADVPDDSESQRGGAFDDAGFPTSRTVLADGRAPLASLDGPGHLLRASYRDPPAPGPMHLVVEPPRAAVGPTLRFSRVRIFPIEPEVWFLRLQPGCRFLGPVDPRELARAVAGAGASPATRVGGVRTPSLVLAGLPLGD